MKKLRIYFFWEELLTDLGEHKRFLVEEASAAPTMDNTERCGIDATLAGMVKFPKSDSSSYRTVIAGLARHCKDAPTIIARRWEKELETLARTRANDAPGLVGLDYKIHIDPSIWLSNGAVERNKYYFAPQETSTAFVGRREILKVIQKALLSSETSISQRSQKRFVIYGMGGCGKTELCCKFAEENKDRFSAIFTIHAKNPQTAKESFSTIGKIGGLEATESAGKYWPSQQKEPWLLIIDNADNPDLELKGLFPRGDEGHVPVTTRIRISEFTVLLDALN
ncbi:hypothetical protein ZTR_05730 [Talaromyces verruculosus]|nr:hypothetical protein ZTR_05730 [Talaromyces verruculosus]